MKTYEKGAIVADLNTNSFYGQRGATITVVIDRPFYAVVQLHDRGYIRTDVVVDPGSIELGSVDQGSRRRSKRERGLRRPRRLADRGREEARIPISPPRRSRPAAATGRCRTG